jgi:hypothetical protein
VTIAVLFGCGSSADKPTSLDESKLLSTLSKDEAKQYCRDMKAWRDKRVSKEMNIKLSCSGTAIASVMSGQWESDTAVRDACKKKLAECIAAPPKDIDKEIDCDKEEGLGEMMACPEVTVGEMNGCVTEMSEKVPKMAEDPCGSVTAADPMSAITKFIEQLKGPKCNAVETKCKSDKGKTRVGPPGQDDAKEHREAAEKIEGFSKQMCDCKDKGCADKVNENMVTWGTELSKKASSTSRPDPEIARKSAEAMTRYTECMTKLLMADAGSAAPAPAPAAPAPAAPPVKQ